jgi:hypothetical protein
MIMVKSRKSAGGPAKSPKPPAYSPQNEFKATAEPLIEFKGTEDVCKAFAKISKAAGRDVKAEKAFVESKLHMLQTDPTLRPRERAIAVKQLAKIVKRKVSKPVTPPVPGGVGYGKFYNPSFRSDFATGTGLYWEIICPQPPGGNVNTWLYLTAMNRAAKGLEAFISYKDQSDTRFKVFDWARTNHWQTNIPFANLGNYLISRSAHGNAYQVLPVMNVTQSTSATSWWNQVWLPNRVTGNLDLIYQYNYTSSATEQKTGFTGTWGPIVETFQSSYSGTNPMGAIRTYLISKNSSNSWGSWHLLSGTDSWVRVDNKGFVLLFNDPNYTWAVDS